MTTGTTPNSPDRPTNQAPPDTAQPQAPAPSADGQPQQPFDLPGDIARIITEQADVLAQRLAYHSQLLFGVGATGVDIVNARNSVMVVANALQKSSEDLAVDTLVSLGTPQNPQINDATLPFRNNSQVAGMLEGLILDTVSQAYSDALDRLRDARLLLDAYFQKANEQLQRRTRALGTITTQGSQGMGPRPNARS